VSIVGDLTLILLILIVLAIASVGLSVIALILVRRSIGRGREQKPAPAATVKPTQPTISPTPPTTPTRGEAAKPEADSRVEARPPMRRAGEELEIKPVEPGEGVGFASLDDLAVMIGAKSILLFNQTGIPIESYNVEDKDKIAASAADFLSLMKKFDPEFSFMISEASQRIMLFMVGKIGEIEVYALTVGGAGSELGAEEVRDLLRAYLSESLGRYR